MFRFSTISSSLPIVLITASPASAADDHDKSVAYIGVQVGWQKIDDHFHGYWKTQPPIAWDLGRHDGNGAVGGIHGGIERPVGSARFGLEADFEGTSGSVDHTQNSWYWTVKNRWQTSLRGRASVKLGGMRAYATGGLAIARVDHDYRSTDVNHPESYRVTRTPAGYIVGGGLERRLSDRLSARLEYRYTNYGDITAEANPAWRDVQMHRIHIQSAQIGFSYRL